MAAPKAEIKTDAETPTGTITETDDSVIAYSSVPPHIISSRRL